MQLEIDALKEASAWPGTGQRTLVVLASQLMAADLYQEGFGYFTAGSDAAPAVKDQFPPALRGAAYEDSAEGLFEATETVMALHPRLLIHGHAGLTDTYTIEAFPGLLAARRDLDNAVRTGITSGLTFHPAGAELTRHGEGWRACLQASSVRPWPGGVENGGCCARGTT